MEEIVRRRRRSLVAMAAGLAVLATPTSRAEPPPHSVMPGVDDVARALAEAITPRWEGPRVPWPDAEARPEGPLRTMRSRYRPLAVHAPPAAPEARVRAALDALEIAFDSLRVVGLEPPYPDGGRGGDARFDLYLAGASGAGARASADAPVAWSALDGVTSFALVDAETPAGSLPGCVTAAYADALLLALDPAESRDARRAMSAFLAHGITGRYGCGEGVADAQASPGLPPLIGAPGDGEGGALLLSRLSRTHDGGTGAFVRALFELARQRTGDGGDLRALPDVPLALERTLERAGTDLPSTMIAFAVDRYLYAPDGGDVPRIAPEWRIARDALPAHPGPSGAPVEVFGSGYAEVDVRGAPAGSRLRVWLRGEHGVDWSLVAITLDRSGAERTRVTAPPGANTRRSYLTVELDDATERVLVVVTNLGPTGTRGAQRTGVDDRRYELVFDLASDPSR